MNFHNIQVFCYHMKQVAIKMQKNLKFILCQHYIQKDVLLLDCITTEVEIFWDSGQIWIIVTQTWFCILIWQEKIQFLEKIHSEQQNFISCQYFTHTRPLSNSKWYNPFTFPEPKVFRGSIKFFQNLFNLLTFHLVLSIFEDQILVDLLWIVGHER